MITRDSFILVLTILASVLTVILAQFNLLPASWQPYQGLVTVISSVIGTIAAVLSRSPLAGEKTPMRDSTTAMGGMFKVTDKKE